MCIGIPINLKKKNTWYNLEFKSSSQTGSGGVELYVYSLLNDFYPIYFIRP